MEAGRENNLDLPVIFDLEVKREYYAKILFFECRCFYIYVLTVSHNSFFLQNSNESTGKSGTASPLMDHD